MSAAARKHTAAALKTLVAALRSEKDEVRVRAAEALLDRGWGRAPQAIRVDVEQRLDLSAVSEEEWQALAQLRHEVRRELPAAAAVVDVDVLGPVDHLPHEKAAEKESSNDASYTPVVRPVVRAEPSEPVPDIPERGTEPAPAPREGP